MSDNESTGPRAEPAGTRAVARDAARRRLRRLTGAAAAGAVALSGVFAGLAAHSQGGKSSESTQSAPVPSTTQAPGSTAASDGSGALSPPSQSPVPSGFPPVVASGGS